MLLGDDGVDVIGTKEQVVLPVDLDLIAAELAVEHLVAHLDVGGDTLALVGELALGLLLRARGYVETRRGLLLLGCGLDEDAIAQRLKSHTKNLLQMRYRSAYPCGVATARQHPLIRRS